MSRKAIRMVSADPIYPTRQHEQAARAVPDIYPAHLELEVGNTLSYTVALWRGGRYLDELRERWLPYYDEGLRRRRLGLVTRYCLNNHDHIPPSVARGLYFQSFKRLWDTFGEFLQALFIARRTYPIAYDKWIGEYSLGQIH